MASEHYPDPHHDTYDKTLFGFWVYLLTDLMVFGSLFATFAVLRSSTMGMPHPRELFYLPLTLLETFCLLITAFTSGMANTYVHKREKRGTIVYYALTFLFGLLFLYLMQDEFSRLFALGLDWTKSAYLSIFFTLVGTLGLHVVVALLWTLVLLYPLISHEITPVSIRRLTCLKMFWQFINLVWVFIFTLVYLVGVLS